VLLSENSFISPSSFHFGRGRAEKKKQLEFSFDRRVNFLSIMRVLFRIFWGRIVGFGTRRDSEGEERLFDAKGEPSTSGNGLTICLVSVFESEIQTSTRKFHVKNRQNFPCRSEVLPRHLTIIVSKTDLMRGMNSAHFKTSERGTRNIFLMLERKSI
jgi:hypothetical protein